MYKERRNALSSDTSVQITSLNNLACCSDDNNYRTKEEVLSLFNHLAVRDDALEKEPFCLNYDQYCGLEGFFWSEDITLLVAQRATLLV